MDRVIMPEREPFAMKHQSNKSSDLPIAIIGGGVIGLSIAWQLARRGASVVLFERDTAGRAASWSAAGMLAPLSEVGFEEEDFLLLGQESLRRYPQFLDELAKDSAIDVSLDTQGTLLVGLDRDDAERLRRLFEFRVHLGLPVEWMSGGGAREIEPLISPRVSSAIWIPDDHQIDNRLLTDALKNAFEKCGGTLHENLPVRKISINNGRASDVHTDDHSFEAAKIVIAAGCWSKQFNGIPKELLPPVRPVKGQIITLKADDTFAMSHVVRAPDAYLLPKADGRVILGASEEEMGFDTTITAGPVYKLLERGWETIPAIYDLAVDEIEAGLRPGSRDHDPIVGETPIAGLYYATGHYRHGILLAPSTAYEMSRLLLDDKSSLLFAPFKPGRFMPADKHAKKR
jgi:glycine oxidase